MNLGKTSLIGKPRNRLQDEVREDGWLVAGIMWKGRLHNREEWKKFLRTAGNCRSVHMPMNESGNKCRDWNCEMQLLDSSSPSLSLSVPPHEQFISEHLWIFRKSLLNINTSLQSDNNSQCFTPDRFTSGWMFCYNETILRHVLRGN